MFVRSAIWSIEAPSVLSQGFLDFRRQSYLYRKVPKLIGTTAPNPQDQDREPLPWLLQTTPRGTSVLYISYENQICPFTILLDADIAAVFLNPHRTHPLLHEGRSEREICAELWVDCVEDEEGVSDALCSLHCSKPPPPSPPLPRHPRPPLPRTPKSEWINGTKRRGGDDEDGGGGMTEGGGLAGHM